MSHGAWGEKCVTHWGKAREVGECHYPENNDFWKFLSTKSFCALQMTYLSVSFGSAMRKIPFSVAPFFAPRPEPHPRPPPCYITDVWLHSTNTLIQRWLSRQQYDDPPSPTSPPIGCWERGIVCDLPPHLPVSWATQCRPESGSCSTNTVSLLNKVGGVCGGNLAEKHNHFFCKN